MWSYRALRGVSRQDAILQAIEVGLEDGYAMAELALARKRERRHEVMDALVAAMEVP